MTPLTDSKQRHEMARVNLKEHLRKVERDFIEEFLTACEGHMTLTAHYLMMNRSTLYFRLKQLGMTQWIKIKGETAQ